MIRIPQVRVVTEDGEQLGVMQTRDALALARERGLDLVEVAPTAKPPVCKIIDYGKLKYIQKKKSQEAKKKQSVVTVKEIQLRPRTEEHDFIVKFRRIEEFLKRGDKVKVCVMFRGREVSFTKQGEDMLNRIIDGVKDYAIVESNPRLEGKRMQMTLTPSANKSSSKPTTAPASVAAK